jgi:DUF1680 family protein
MSMSGHVVKGYVRIARHWVAGDVVDLDLEMPVERVYAHPEVSADAGRVALQRGPLVYCLEDADNSIALDRLGLAPTSRLVAHKVDNLLGGVVAVQGEAVALDEDGWDGSLYRHEPPTTVPRQFMAVPYYAWNNRGPGKMRVWMREAGRQGESHARSR